MRPSAVSAALAATVLAAGLSSCSGASTNSDPEDRPYPPALVTELKALKQQSGLFTHPSSPTEGAVSLYSTAIYPPDVRPVSDVKLWAVALTGSNEGTIDSPTLYTWAYVTLSRASPQSPVQLPNLPGMTAALPPESSDSGQTIGTLWAWADMTARMTPQPSASDRAEASRRLNAVDASTIDSPYLLWRMGTALDALGMPRPDSLQQAWSKAARPLSLSRIEDILDEQGYLEIQAAFSSAPPTMDPAEQERLTKRLSSLGRGDDLPAASLGRSLQLAGGDAEPVRELLKGRVDEASGLLRQTVNKTGSVEETYQVARLIPQDFASIADGTTRDSLRSALNTAGISRQDTVEALAALKLAGENVDAITPPSLREAIAALASAQVTETELPSTEAFIEAARMIDQEVPTPGLAPFEEHTDEDGYAARLALAHRDMFANSGAIASWFPETQPKLIDDSLHPDEPVKTYLTGLVAISGAGTLSPSSAQQESIAAALDPLRGCPDFPDLYRTTISDSHSCDLEATHLAIESSYAYHASKK